MHLNLIPWSPDYAERWDTLVSSSPDGWLFGCSTWIELQKQIPEWDLLDCSFTLESGGDLIAVMPLQLRPDRTLISTAMAPSGPCLAPGLDPSTINTIFRTVLTHAEQRAMQLKAARIEIDFPPLASSSLNNSLGVNPLLRYGFRDISTYTCLLSLRKPQDTLWADLSVLSRREIRSAMRTGYTVRQVSWSDHLDAYYAAHRETYTRTGVKPHPRRYFEAIAAGFGERGESILLAGYDPDGNAVAFRNEARFRRGSFYWSGCARNHALDSGINSLLCWQSIMGAQAAGCEWYDLGECFPGTTNPKLNGLTRFKTRFGGTLRRYYKAERILQPYRPLRVASREWLDATLNLARAVRLRLAGKYRPTHIHD